MIIVPTPHISCAKQAFRCNEPNSPQIEPLSCIDHALTVGAMGVRSIAVTAGFTTVNYKRS